MAINPEEKFRSAKKAGGGRFFIVSNNFYEFGIFDTEKDEVVLAMTHPSIDHLEGSRFSISVEPQDGPITTRIFDAVNRTWKEKK